MPASIQSDQEIIDLLNNNEDEAIELLFDRYYSYLCSVVYRVVHDYEASRDIVQDIFLGFWKKKGELTITSALRPYLRRTAINRGLNYIRQQRLQFEETDDNVYQISSNAASSIQHMEKSELEVRINAAIEKLPPKCKVVFSLSRFEDLTYQEIADTLGISIKTVENQISKALRMLRSDLHDYIK